MSLRLKNVWNFVPIPAKLKLFADRITLSKLTIFYFVFSILHCIIQVVFQVEAFKINETAANFLNSVIVQGGVSEAGFTVYEDNKLRWCTSVPQSFDASECQVIWNGTQVVGNATAFLDNTQDPSNYPVNVASLPASSVPSSGSAPSSSVVSLQSSTSVASSSSAPSSSVVLPQSSSPAASSSSAARSSSSPVSATVSVRSSASAVSATSSKAQASETPLAVALASLEAGDLFIPTQTNEVEVTVTVKVAPTASVITLNDLVHDHDDKKRGLAGETKVISTFAVNGTREIQVLGLPGRPNDKVTLTESCLVALNWPLARVDNTKREDIVFIGFSFWVLGMSLVALLNESPPHIIASFLTHCLATGWSAFQLTNTQTFKKDFTRLATRGACQGVNLLPTYWTQRAQFEIPTLAFNALALLISAILSWKLMKSFGWQTFKRIGASLTISRAYRIILIFSITIQLSVFFVVVSVALWIDQVYNGDIGHLTNRAAMFKGIMIAILLLVLPWLTIGWISVRREQKIPMAIFLFLSFGYTVGWSSMFAAPSFRWTFVEWFFFGLMTCASVVLAIVTLVLGLVCRLNFGKGVSRYLNAQQPLPGDEFEPAYPPSDASSFTFTDDKWGSDEEKVEFPSYNTSIPIPPHAQVPAPPPAYAQTAARVLGPRFYQGSGNPGFSFDQRPAMDSFTTMVSQPSSKNLARQTSGSSQHSISSMRSISTDTSSNMRGKRWVIE
ncbi:hypothetical protein BC629DRAFT_1591233 [Irpex lacteus]|nr:hypothetical protein BC629DRAFT_1591233 [Irpex lacteus]